MRGSTVETDAIASGATVTTCVTSSLATIPTGFVATALTANSGGCLNAFGSLLSVATLRNFNGINADTTVDACILSLSNVPKGWVVASVSAVSAACPAGNGFSYIAASLKYLAAAGSTSNGCISGLDKIPDGWVVQSVSSATNSALCPTIGNVVSYQAVLAVVGTAGAISTTACVDINLTNLPKDWVVTALSVSTLCPTVGTTQALLATIQRINGVTGVTTVSSVISTSTVAIPTGWLATPTINQLAAISGVSVTYYTFPIMNYIGKTAFSYCAEAALRNMPVGYYPTTLGTGPTTCSSNLSIYKYYRFMLVKQLPTSGTISACIHPSSTFPYDGWMVKSIQSTNSNYCANYAFSTPWVLATLVKV
jgi:hypothetical protein